MTVLSSLALALSVAVSATQPAVPVGADDLRAQSPVAIEEPDVPVGQLSFSAESDELETLRDISEAHEAACRELGRAQCQVISFQRAMSDRNGGRIEFRLAPGLAPAFADKLIALRSGVSFNATPRNPNQGGRYSAASLEVSRNLITAQLEAARELQASRDAEVRQEAINRSNRLERELERIEVSIAEATESLDFETLTVLYQASRPYQRGTWSNASRQTDELFAMFFLFALGAVALAILSSIYFGIIGFFLLKFRKLAIRLGLINGTLPKPKSGPEPKTKEPEAITPSSKAVARD